MIGNIVFFTPARMAELWENVETLLKMVSPGVMIMAALTLLGFLLVTVVNLFRESAAPKRRGDDDDDEVEVRHY